MVTELATRKALANLVWNEIVTTKFAVIRFLLGNDGYIVQKTSAVPVPQDERSSAVVCGSRLGHKRKLVQLPHLITNHARMKRETEEHQYDLGLIWDIAFSSLAFQFDPLVFPCG